ncbi:MAG: hypothetical protein ACU84H_07860 [Gammaproteobacteria bacterium]
MSASSSKFENAEADWIVAIDFIQNVCGRGGLRWRDSIDGNQQGRGGHWPIGRCPIRLSPWDGFIKGYEHIFIIVISAFMKYQGFGNKIINIIEICKEKRGRPMTRKQPINKENINNPFFVESVKKLQDHLGYERLQRLAPAMSIVLNSE